VAVGLYSGVSGLALGIGLYRNVSGLWGGASGLINGFGGADPYAGASLYLNFLDPVLDSRITFSRGTNATLIDSTGKLTYAPNNLLLRSQEFDNAAWGKTDATVTANTAIAPDGTLTADTLTTTVAVNPNAQQSLVGPQTGLTFMFSVWVRAGNSSEASVQLFVNSGLPSGLVPITGGIASGPGTANLGGAASGTMRVTGLSTTEWTRIYAVGTSASTSGNFTAYIKNRTVSPQVGDTILFWGAQLEQVTYQTTPSTYVATTASAYYGPRFDYDPVTLAPRGLLIEEARTNLLTYSDDWSNAAWIKQQVTISTNVTLSPDGTANADKIAEDNTTAFHRAYQTINKAASAITYVYTVYIKAAERTTASVFIQDSGVFAQTDINLVTGALSNIVGTVSATNAGNGWWRVSVSGTSGAFATALCMVASNNGGSFLGTTGSGIYVWGAQAEAASFATSYIPTVASTVTRNADVATMTGTNFSSWYNQSEGTFIADVGRFSSVNSTGTAGFLSATDNPLANDWILMFGDGIGTPSIYVTGGVTQANLVGAPITSGGKVSFAYAANDFAASVNGGTVLTDTSGTLTTDITVLRIGAFASNPNYLNGHVRTIAYFNTRLPNAQLQTLTAPSLATTLSLDFTSGSYNVGF